MPIYEYFCKNCGFTDDFLHRIDDPPPQECPACKCLGALSKTFGSSKSSEKTKKDKEKE